MDSLSIVPYPQSIVNRLLSRNLTAIKLESLLESSHRIEYSPELQNLIAKLLRQFRERSFEPITKEEKDMLNSHLRMPKNIIEFIDKVVGKNMQQIYVRESWGLLLEVYSQGIDLEEPNCYYTLFDEFNDKEEEVNFRWPSISCHIGYNLISLSIYQSGDEETVSKEFVYPTTSEGRKEAAEVIRYYVLNVPGKRAEKNEGEQSGVSQQPSQEGIPDKLQSQQEVQEVQEGVHV